MRASLVASAARVLVIIALAAFPFPSIVSANPGTGIVAQFGGASYAIASAGDVVCVGMGPNLVLLSLSDSQWVAVASLAMPDIVRGLAVDDGFAYVAAGSQGLRIVSLGDPARPVEVASVALAGEAMGLVVSQGYAYVAAGQGGVAVIDLQDPAAPGAPYQVDVQGEAMDVAVAGSYAYVAAGWGALRVLSISDPARPVEVGAYLQVYEVFGVATHGSYAYLAAGDELKILSLSNPEQPELVTSEPVAEGIARSVSILEDAGNSRIYACIAAQHGGLRILEVTHASTPAEVSAYATPGPDARDLEIVGDLIYVADGAGGVDAVDIRQPSHPTRIGSYTLLGDAHDAAIAGDHLFVAGGVLGLHSLSRQGEQLALLNTLDTPGIAFRVAVSGTYAYVADLEGGLCIISVADPLHMSERRCLPGPAPVYAVAVRDHYVYAAAGEAGLWIVDVQDPIAPSAALTVPLPGEATDVALSGEYAFVAAGERGLRVVSVADPNAAFEVGQGMETPGNATSLALVDGRAYVADSELGVIMADISDPAQPQAVGAASVAGVALDLDVVGDLVYIAAETEGLEVLSFADPTNPEVSASVSIPGSSKGVRYDPLSQLAFVAARDGGLVVVSMQREYSVHLPIVRKGG
jgi:hypothetical protein